MPNPPEPGRHGPPKRRGFDSHAPGSDAATNRGEPAGERITNPADEIADDAPLVPTDAETATVIFTKPDPGNDPEKPEEKRERRFTAPGFDAKETQVITTARETATEVFPVPRRPAPPPPTPVATPSKSAVPQSFPPRTGSVKPPASKQRNWGWALAIVVIILALAAIAILGTLLLTRNKQSHVSQEDQVRHTIEAFDISIQTGDLTVLRSITCGTTREGYAEYDEHAWAETYRRASAAKQYPVIASIDQVVVNGGHAEANVTAFMAYDPQVRSTRSLDLQFRDDQWKICQSASN